MWNSPIRNDTNWLCRPPRRCPRMLALLLSALGILFVCTDALRANPRLNLALQPLVSQTENQGEQQEQDVQAQIDALIRQLGSSDFNKRQIAIEELWQFGMQAKEALGRASKNGDPEVARRAGELLTVLSMGIDSNTNPELAKLILRFNDSEKAVRVAILKGLLREEKLELVFELLGQVKSDSERKSLYTMAIPLKSTISTFGRAGKWDEIEFILDHPMTLEFATTYVIQYQMSKNELGPFIEKMKADFKADEDDGKKQNDKALHRLISILMMEGEFEEAKLYIAKIKKDSFRNKLMKQVLIEKGEWETISQKLAKEDDDLNDGRGLIKVTDIQRSLIAKYIGDEKAYEESVTTVRKKLEESQKDKDKPKEKQWKEVLVKIGALNLDWALVDEFMDREAPETFDLLLEFRRIDEAFKLIDFDESVERRGLWFNRKMRYIKTLRAKSKRLDDKGEDSDATDTKLEIQWNNCKAIASMLDGLGYSDEAVAYLHILFENYSAEEHSSKRAAIIWRLVWMNRCEEARKLVKNGFRPDEFKNLVKYVFISHKDSAAEFWYRILTQRYPDNFKRLQVAAGIVNSPFCNIPDFNLDYELANVPPTVSYQKSGSWDYQLARAYEFHGRERDFNLHMDVSKQLGYGSAKSFALRKARMDGDYDALIKYYDTSPNNRTAYSALLAAEAFKKKGDIRNAALRRTLAFAYWGSSYRTTSTLNLLKSADKQYLATDFLKLQIYQFDKLTEKAVTNERYRSQFAKSFAKSDPEMAVAQNRILAFNNANTEKPGDLSSTYWIDLAIETELARAKSLIAKGDLKAAADIMIKCDQFAPGDPGIGETLFAELEAAGGKDEATRVFESMSKFYFEFLQKHPNSPLHHNNYAWLCVNAKRNLDHMQRHAELAVASRPRHTSYLDTLATIYFVRGERKKAIKTIKECINHYPSKQRYRDQLRKFTAKADDSLK